MQCCIVFLSSRCGFVRFFVHTACINTFSGDSTRQCQLYVECIANATMSYCVGVPTANSNRFARPTCPKVLLGSVTGVTNNIAQSHCRNGRDVISHNRSHSRSSSSSLFSCQQLMCIRVTSSQLQLSAMLTAEVSKQTLHRGSLSLGTGQGPMCDHYLDTSNQDGPIK